MQHARAPLRDFVFENTPHTRNHRVRDMAWRVQLELLDRNVLDQRFLDVTGYIPQIGRGIYPANWTRNISRNLDAGYIPHIGLTRTLDAVYIPQIGRGIYPANCTRDVSRNFGRGIYPANCMLNISRKLHAGRIPHIRLTRTLDAGYRIGRGIYPANCTRDVSRNLDAGERRARYS